MIRLTAQDFSPNLYIRLDIERTADVETIKTAYRKRAMETHPDKNRDNPDAEKEFVAVGRAYEVLSNTSTRAQYDAELARKQPEQNSSRTRTHANTNNQTHRSHDARAQAGFEEAWQRAQNSKYTNPYEGFEYTQEELQRYKEAAARLASGNSRRGDLSTVFNWHASGKKAPTLGQEKRADRTLLPEQKDLLGKSALMLEELDSKIAQNAKNFLSPSL